MPNPSMDTTERTDSALMAANDANAPAKTAGQPGTPKLQVLPNVGTPEATAPAPVYFRGKTATEGSTGTAVPAGSDGSPTVLRGEATTVPMVPMVPNDATEPKASTGDHYLLKHYLNQEQHGAAALQHFGTNDVKDAAKIISKMGQRDLQAKFKLVYGQATHSNNNEWLRRKLCEGVGALPMKPPHKHRGRKKPRRSKKKQRHQLPVAEELAGKRARVPSQKMRECILEGGSDDQALGSGIHIRLSKDGVYRSTSLPVRSPKGAKGRNPATQMGRGHVGHAGLNTVNASPDDSLYTTTTDVGGGLGDDGDSYPYPYPYLYADPYEPSLLSGFNSLPVVLGHSNSTTDLTELVRRVDREEKQEQERLMGTMSPEEAPMNNWVHDADEVLLVDVGAPFICNPALTEAQGLL